MCQRQKGFNGIILIIVVFILTAVSVACYFFIKNDNLFGSSAVNQGKTNDEQNSQSYINTLITEARLKVESETKILGELAERSNNEHQAVNNINTKYTAINDIFKKDIDTLFKNPKSQNPEIKIKLADVELQKNINSQRHQVEIALANLKSQIEQYKSDTASGSKVAVSNISLAEIIKNSDQDLAVIENYLNQLQGLVDNLSVNNSNLTLVQIGHYQDLVNNAITAIENIPSPSPVISSNSGNSNQSQPIVTPVQIINQQVVVDQAIANQAQVETTNNETGTQNSTESTNQNTPDKTLPVVILKAPAGGSTVSYTVSVSASASDPDGIAKVEFYSESTLIGYDTTAPYSILWNTTNSADGKYGLSAKAYDVFENTKLSAPVFVTVLNGNSSGDGINHPAEPELIEGANKIDF